jgi:hypothetical protein
MVVGRSVGGDLSAAVEIAERDVQERERRAPRDLPDRQRRNVGRRKHGGRHNDHNKRGTEGNQRLLHQIIRDQPDVAIKLFRL